MGFTQEDLTGFVEKYRGEQVQAGKLQITLDQALQAEALLCPADAENRQDPITRGRYMANMLHQTGALLPEDHFLLEEA